MDIIEIQEKLKSMISEHTLQANEAQEESIKKEQEDEKIQFSEPKQSFEETVSREEYMQKKVEMFFANFRNPERYEELKNEIEGIESKFSKDELRKLSEKVPAKDKEQVEHGINRQKELYKEAFGRRRI